MDEFGSIGIVKCNNCNLIYTSPRPLESEKNYHGDINLYEKERWKCWVYYVL